MQASFMEERERIKMIMMNSFREEIRILSPELQSILIDDVVTAFYNRLNVLKRIQQ